MEGDTSTQPPWEWIVSRVCEEFSCLPSAAVNEIMDDPNNYALDILELRAYQRAKEALDNAKKPTDVPKTPMVEKVWEVQAELHKQKKGKK